MAFSPDDAAFVCHQFGIDVDRPLITQVSRFDPWKDPIGVIDAYREVTKEMPEVQLALVGSMATDDPEGWEFFQQTFEYADGDPDIKILNNLNNVGAIEVNAFQSQSDVCLQKSIREGFGLTVTEALWKGRPTVAGNVGGIPLQIEDGESGYLVNSPVGVRTALPRDPRRPGAGQAPRQSGQGTRPPRVPLAAPAARLAGAVQRTRRVARTDGVGSGRARLRPPDHRLQPRAGAVRARRGRRAHRAARRRRPGDGALGPRLPPRRALDRLGDDRRGRRGQRGARAGRSSSRSTGSTTGCCWSAATPTPTTASTT